MLKIKKPTVVAPPLPSTIAGSGKTNFNPLYEYYHGSAGISIYEEAIFDPNTPLEHWFWTFAEEGMDALALVVVEPKSYTFLTTSIYIDDELVTESSGPIYPNQGEIIAFNYPFIIPPGYHFVNIVLSVEYEVEMNAFVLFGYGKRTRTYERELKDVGYSDFNLGFDSELLIIPTFFLLRDGKVYADISLEEEEEKIYRVIPQQGFWRDVKPYNLKFKFYDISPQRIVFKHDIILVEEFINVFSFSELPFGKHVSLVVTREKYGYYTYTNTDLCFSTKRYLEFRKPNANISFVSFGTDVNEDKCIEISSMRRGGIT